jgi:hypothetical protein
MKTASSNAEENLNEQSRLDSFLYSMGLSFGTLLLTTGILIIIVGVIWFATFDFGSAFPKDYKSIQ